MTTFLECSLGNAYETQSNAQWTNNFAPLQIPTGSEIILKSAFIDTRQSGSYSNIVLAEDVNITVKFGYYVMYLKEGLFDATPAYDADFQPHVARDENQALIIGTKSFTIDSGSYTPSILAELVTRKLTEVPHQSLNQFENSYNHFLLLSNNYFAVPCNKIENTTKGDNIDTWQATNTLTPEAVNALQVGTEVKVIFSIDWGEGPVWQNLNTEIKSVNGGTGVIETDDAYTITVTGSVLSKIVIQLKTPTPIKFYNQKDITKYLEYKDNRFFGASEVALTFDLEGSNRFQFQYIHTPYFKTVNDSSLEAVGWMLDDNNVLQMVDGRSGIFWTDLQPTTFWSTTLGFDMNSILVADSNAKTLDPQLQRGVNMTANYFSLDNMFQKSEKMEVPSESFNSESQATIPIRSSEDFAAITDGGYFLVAIDGLRTYYKEDSQQRHDIMAIVSRQYSSLGYISDWGNASNIFINNGNTFNLSSLSIRILDPKTKLPVENLGDGNSIFLEINLAKEKKK